MPNLIAHHHCETSKKNSKTISRPFELFCACLNFFMLHTYILSMLFVLVWLVPFYLRVPSCGKERDEKNNKLCGNINSIANIKIAIAPIISSTLYSTFSHKFHLSNVRELLSSFFSLHSVCSCEVIWSRKIK